MRKYSFSHRVINEWNKLPNDCVNASSVNMLHIDEKNCWTLDKPVASLSTCHPELVVWDGNLVKFLLKLFWICRQTFSTNVVNVTVIDFGHFFGGYFP